jgi:UDP-GlcNAc3NAcA epimerase
MHLITIVGARPQFIKAAPVSVALKAKNIQETIIHTGQHYDRNMSDIFFEELDIQKPTYELGIKAATHGAMTGRMLEHVEKILMKENPDLVLVYGDTNSTLAGALAAAKLNIPVAHVEAGLRSFNRQMPEETNRIITDHISDLLFAPTSTATENLHAEGIRNGIYHTGDVMYDAALLFSDLSEAKSRALERFGLEPGHYILATVHRVENTDNPDRLHSIFKALLTISADTRVVLPLHPRTAKKLELAGLQSPSPDLCLIPPLSFLDMIALEKSAKLIMTDSGGIQKEAYFHSVPCVTMRNETEWVETVRSGWNTLAGADCKKIINAAQSAKPGHLVEEYGTGNAAFMIADIILSAAHFSDE